MSTAVAPRTSAVESALIQNDLASLKPEERLAYYKSVCESLGLNPLTQPFSYIVLNGKLQLYAKRDCTDQLRKIHSVSIEKLHREVVEGVYTVTATAKDTSGRTDESIGAVSIEKLTGNDRANAMMKAETKSKRRVTLSICGLGCLDETEIETIHDAQPAEQIGNGQPEQPRTKGLTPPEADGLLALAKQAGVSERSLLKKVSDEAGYEVASPMDIPAEHLNALRKVMLDRIELQAKRKPDLTREPDDVQPPAGWQNADAGVT